MAEHVPPGRAGRMWLVERIDIAARGVELLRQKRQLLRREQRRLSLMAEQTAAAWASAAADAERWGSRAAALGGSTAVRLAACDIAGQGTVSILWRNTMGTRHPDEARCELPTLTPSVAAASNAAIAPAATAYGGALRAAAEHAVASAALRAVEIELASTQRRLRAIEHHRLPALQSQLHDLVLRLDELEREERLISRWAMRRGREIPR
ncbi:MAG TPA: V-type ATP synthase subunit D [Acidimicrobiales bacterium]|nr:V-type ATP synthase subunit D [Acidimicrobiales bacterium]